MIDFIGRTRSQEILDLQALPDDGLLHHYQSTTDLQVISVLLDRYKDLIVGMSMRFLKDQDDVRDFIGRLYLKLVEKLEHSEVKNARAWLCMVTMNLLRDDNRKGIVRDQYRKTLTEEVDWAERKTDFQMDTGHLQSAMDNCLTDKEQSVVRMIYYDDKSYREIMDETGWSFNQVRGLRERAIRKLKDGLGGEFSDYLQVS
ncbi:MAG: sigma-70 family RNA polymerase sigma factor [Bacteroidia bacterium]|nr:sigma-70 family RNA polymerase sigma factor [Bacteroidia bacterium]